MEEKTKIIVLTSIFFVIFLLFLFLNLGKRSLFGVEGRWAEAAREMSLRKSWFVPTINFEPHITKPLIPFWLIKISGEIQKNFNEFTVRLPGIFLSLLALLSFYILTSKLFKFPLNLITTGFFSTSLGFVQFTRLAQSEIYQLTGIIIALTFYICYREKRSFLGYLGFFLGMSLGGLSKGLTSFATLIPFFLTDIIVNRKFYHLNYKSFFAFLISLIVYFIPYFLTSQELGSNLPFYLWLKENVIQAVNPYDNLRPFYIYFYYILLWVFPWSLFLIGAFLYVFKNFKKTREEERLFFFSLLIIFLIFTLAKARRGYYILPILPFCIILIGYYFKNISSNWIKNFYKYFNYFLLILLIISPFILIKSGYSLKKEFIFSLIIIIFLQLFSLFLFKKEFIFSCIFQVFLVEFLFFSILQPIYSKSAEKDAGIFVKTLKEKNNYIKTCSFSPFKKPVANFYFYAQIKEKIEDVNKFEEALKKCDIIVIRKNISSVLKKQAEVENFMYRKFIDKEDENKNYFIFFRKNLL